MRTSCWSHASKVKLLVMPIKYCIFAVSNLGEQSTVCITDTNLAGMIAAFGKWTSTVGGMLQAGDASYKECVSNIAYNIVNGECSPLKNLSAPVCITIGDGGSIEGLANMSTLSEVDEKLMISGVDGILMDLGMSSMQMIKTHT